MYRRYSQSGKYINPVSRKGNTARNVVIIVLLAVIAALCVIGIPALNATSGLKNDYISILRTECYDALTTTDKLSRTASASSNTMLAHIRSNVHAMQVINNESDVGSSGKLLDETILSNILNEIDVYLDFVITGMDTGEKQTQLSNDLSALLDTIQAMD